MGGVVRSIRRQLQLLERELSQLEQEHRDTSNVHTSGHIHAKLQEFQETALSEIQHLGKYATARVYGQGDRPGGVRANLIRPSRNANTIKTAEAEDGSVIGDSESIAARFREYYQSLYQGGPRSRGSVGLSHPYHDTKVVRCR
ncbi:hypothetical protein NDU88_005530 [Pleurodeles waltl]|uniref:Uncharacterized protein n=1 Tax=Pleurodeles waltl TaxID=8319 RepID=A0AAV7RML0_PLEWA|nr:hypothetical protein NDU88_005530 [Pleurodeles waltl]